MPRISPARDREGDVAQDAPTAEVDGDGLGRQARRGRGGHGAGLGGGGAALPTGSEPLTSLIDTFPVAR